MQKKTKLIFSIIIVSSLALITSTSIYLTLLNKRYFNGIYKYNAKKDRKFLVNLFKDNMKTLVQNPKFSVDYFLDNLAPTKKPSSHGLSKIFLYYLDKKPAGFVSFYKYNFYKGKVHFLAVDKDFRRRGIGKKLMEYAFSELKKQNLSVVYIHTTVDNEKAQNLYKKIGFKEVDRTKSILTLEKKI